MTTANPTERIAQWVAQLQFTDVPRRVAEEAKNQILSVIAAVHAGHFCEAGRAVSRTVKEWSGGKEATMIPSGERTALYNAIFANSALSMALDYDDYLFGGHTGHSAVLVTLALAEKFGFSGKDFLVAQVLANEIEGRVGAAAACGPLHEPLVSFIHLIGGAVVAAKLLGLDAAQIQSAIGLAMTQPNRMLQAGAFGSDGRMFAVAMTAPLGVQAAQCAANGLCGAPQVLEDLHGVLGGCGQPPLPGMYEGLGKVWLSDTLCYKVYPGCAYLDSTIDCVLTLARQHTIDARKVKAVHVAANPGTLEMDAIATAYVKGPESLPATLHQHLGYNVAAALMDRELTARQFSRERIRDRATWDLAARMHLSHSAVMAQRMRERALVKRAQDVAGEPAGFDLGSLDLSGFKMSCGAQVRIELEDGRSYDAEQEVPFGAAGRPYDERRKSVEDKFRRETRYTLRKEKMERAVDLILHLEQTNSAQLRELVRLCCSERS